MMEDDYGDEDEGEWGYYDEQGQWIAFDEGDAEAQFLESQLPSDDEILGLSSAKDGEAAEDEWGYYDDHTGKWISFGAEADKVLDAQQASRTVR